jgi:hypothetical protein
MLPKTNNVAYYTVAPFTNKKVLIANVNTKTFFKITNLEQKDRVFVSTNFFILDICE